MLTKIRFEGISLEDSIQSDNERSNNKGSYNKRLYDDGPDNPSSDGDQYHMYDDDNPSVGNCNDGDLNESPDDEGWTDNNEQRKIVR